jgi:formylglycine-generating enzyme required for sulfatase activity
MVPRMADTPKGMAWVPGGEFLMGSNDFCSEERPVHEVGVDGSGWTYIQSRSPSFDGS